MFYNSLWLISCSVTIYITCIKLPQSFVPLGNWGGGTCCVHLSVSSYSDTPPETLFSSDSFKMSTSKISVVLISQDPKENDAIVSNWIFHYMSGHVVWGMGDLKTCHCRLLWSVCIGDNQTSFISFSAWSKMGHSWPYRQNYFLNLGFRDQLSPFLTAHSWTLSLGFKTKDSPFMCKTSICLEELLL